MNISGLADADLAEIFQRLPLYERLIVSEVCRRWRVASPSAWVDVRAIDLTPIPCANIGAIITRCPNLQSVIAVKKIFAARSLFFLPKAALLTSLKFYDCTFEINETLLDESSPLRILFENIFFSSVERVAWSELVLQKVCVVDSVVIVSKNHKSQFVVLPASLTHLQLDRLRAEGGESFCLLPLDLLQNLECFIQQQPADNGHFGFSSDIWIDSIGNLKQLKELSFSPAPKFYTTTQLYDFVAMMPRLELLMLNDVGYFTANTLAAVITRPSSLRILVISGERFAENRLYPIEIPARKRFANGFDGVALRELHVFLGQAAAAKMRFEESALVKQYLIDQPMPEFLEREDIAPIFKDSWIAAQIKESAKNGGNL